MKAQEFIPAGITAYKVVTNDKFDPATLKVLATEQAAKDWIKARGLEHQAHAEPLDL